MNICYVSREYLGSKRAGGIATYVHEISRIMQRLGHKVFIICASDHVAKGEQKVIDEINYVFLAGADFYIHPNRYVQLVFTKLRELLFYNSYRKRIVKVIEKLNMDVGINIIEFPEFGNEAKYWLRQKSQIVPTIIRFHGPSGHNRELNTFNIENKYVKDELISSFKADGISFCSEAMRNTLKGNKFSADLLLNFKNKQIVIFNPIVIPNKEFQKSHNIKFIFTAGSFVESKGFKELIEAVKIINENDFPMHLIIAGKLGKLGVEYLSKSKRDNGYKNWLKILGPVRRESLYDYYNKAELCCFPSYWEPFGLTCIEAMSVNALVLGSSSGGMSEIIDDEIDGFLVEPKNGYLLKNKILSILSLDEKQKRRIRNNAKLKITDNFSEKIIAKQMENFYSELIKS